ncbi:uridine phosphorylase [Saprospira grandis DSM 2844]|uniref:Uridine phosphorylase n=1 Tax=Saprospira grandis DSM 2844 TaxID=694433 RepID=J1I8T2_9BACT|nr:nucleoside phosphorylase [Saprospira grandis]EJF54878.1 uridine phosphorylase [Saprospira grandis DSM 2844]
MSLAASELILNPDGSIYHLNMQPEQLADTVILVGDPERVSKISCYFDRIDTEIRKREFVIHTGEMGGKRITVMSTGMGTDNIDIVINELDALVNIDLKTRSLKKELRSLKLLRIGTSGSLREDIPVGSLLMSRYSIGLEGLLGFYERPMSEKENLLAQKAQALLAGLDFGIRPEAVSCGTALLEQFRPAGFLEGITLTATGFYAPQNRELRAKNRMPELLSKFRALEFDGYKATNLEMETAGIYGLARALGHQALSLNAILANREAGIFHDQPKKLVKELIEKSLELI